MPVAHDDIQAVLFDCDGTLVDSEPISMAVLREMLAGHGLEISQADAMDRWAGSDLQNVFDEAERAIGRKLPADFATCFRSAQLERLASEVQAMPGASDLLQSIVPDRCVVSNAPLKKMTCCLETTGLLKYFDASRLFSAYQVQAWKPEPDLFLHAASQLGVAPENCVVIEDSRFGIDAARNAGMRAFVLDPKRRHLHEYANAAAIEPGSSPAKTNHPVLRVDSLTDLIPVLTPEHT